MTLSINATPTGEHPALPTLGERIASDLRTLGDLAARYPAVAAELARTLAQLYIVVTHASPLAHHEVGDPLIEAGARRTVPVMQEPWWETQSWQLPAGAVELVMTRLAVPVAVEQNAAAS